jgi:hypothetical protein
VYGPRRSFVWPPRNYARCEMRRNKYIGRHAAFTSSEGQKTWCAREELQICEWKNYTEHRGSYAYVSSLVGKVVKIITVSSEIGNHHKVANCVGDHASPFVLPMNAA